MNNAGKPYQCHYAKTVSLIIGLFVPKSIEINYTSGVKIRLAKYFPMQLISPVITCL